MLMNYSGHVTAKKNLLTVLAQKLQNSPKEIAGVGCANISPEKQNFIGRVSSIAFSGVMGGRNFFDQNAEFDQERYVDHMSFTCYRKKIVEDVGNFDPGFWCGQDAELDIRIWNAGYKILYSPETKVYHYKRPTVKSLFRQMYRYGIARAKIVKKHHGSLRFIYLLGPGFILGILGLIILTILKWIPLWVFPALVLLYIMLCLVSSFQITRKPSLIVSSILLYFLIHVGYGFGFLRGLIYSRL
jgi:GT2 family glycosyltransferase